MTSSPNSSTLDSSDETLNGTKLMRLILDGGTEALRNVFIRIHPAPGDLQVVLSNDKHILSKLKRKNVLKQIQWDTLYPTPPRLPNINDFDITLLSVLLRNICGLTPPSTGWDNKPNNLDYSVEADVVRIKLFRNQCFGHKTKTAISAADFKRIWAEISLPLIRLGVGKGEIDKLENQKCGPDEIGRVLKEWTNLDKKIFSTLESMETKLSENNNILKKLGQNEFQLSSVLDKFLVHFDFTKEIQLYLSRYVSGTRLWVLEQVTEWFHDENSKHRAFVIFSPAGMGKSVLAAVICDKFEKNAAYCHFIQYNNSQYNNPNFLLQSLAWHLCQVFPAYKQALVKKLSGNLGRTLNNMNIEGLYSILLNELLTNKEEPEERLLIVLDAVDEIEHSGRHELANLITNHLHKLPAYIRFVITARPEKNPLDKFLKLNPLFIELDDERNLNDIKLVIQNNLPSACQPNVHTRLAEKCGGLMLYAYFLTQVYQDENFGESQTSLPGGIDEYYENYLQRLERELGLLGVSNHQFLSFLSALAVAQEPITESFARSIFQFESNVGTKQKVSDTLNSLSSLFLIHEDRSISFFHKSVRDWLVNNDKYRYCIDIKCSHDVLFDLCVEELKSLKQQSVTCDLLTDVALRYALKYCIVHLLQGNVDKQKMESFVTDYVTDLQVMFAGVYFDIDLIVNNLYMLTQHDCFQNVSEGARFTLNKLILLLRNSGSVLHSHPKTFLQSVVNEGGEDLSLKASKLLETRYKKFMYLEYLIKHEKSGICDVRFHLKRSLRSVDISPNHDYALCWYHKNEIEVFSLTTGRSEWKMSVPSIFSRNFGQFKIYVHNRQVVFHPFKQLILPGKLDEVLTFRGTITTGPFQIHESVSDLCHICFSSDGKKMATVHFKGPDLCIVIVWNVLTGVEEKRFPCSFPSSFSFTASGNYLGALDIDGNFNICDLTRDYEVKSGKIRITYEDNFPMLISSFDQNSWLFCYNRFDPSNMDSVNDIIILNSDFSERLFRNSPFIKNFQAPSTTRICNGLQSFIDNHDDSWFSRTTTQIISLLGLREHLDPYYLIINDKYLLVFGLDFDTMNIVSLDRLGNSNEKLSKRPRSFSAISNNGDFVYLCGDKGKSLFICDVNSEKRKDTRRLISFNQVRLISLVAVRNGVVLFKDDLTLGLWNSDLTEHLSSFDELTGVRQCWSVSDEVIACKVSRHCVVFFNVLNKKVIYRINHWLLAAGCVLACSVRGHVLVYRCLMKRFDQLRLLRNEREVECAHEVFKETVFSKKKSFIGAAKFSPDGHKLVLNHRKNHEKYIIYL